MEKRLILGLGNPGQEYAGTRHNVGFWVTSLLSKRHNIPMKQFRHQSRYGMGVIQGVPVILAQPMTYMNLSGQAARSLLNAFQLKPSQMLVVYDDFALPLGAIRLRESGSSGGQKGMKSIIERLGTQEFPRLRLGIGSPDSAAVDHVLSTFDAQEKEDMLITLEHAADAVEAWLTDPMSLVMSRYNKNWIQPPPSETS